MRLLALDAALGRCSAAVLRDGAIVAECQRDGRSGEAALLPALAGAVLARAGLRAADLDAIAATVGPGSFTGLRAAMALAQGLALVAGARLIAVTVPEALAAAVAPSPGRALWVALDSRRRGRIFLAAEGALRAVMLPELPQPAGPVVVAGDAAPLAAAWLAARGADVQLSAVRAPRAGDVARVAGQRLPGALPERPMQPLYLDAPEVRLPRDAGRPAPVLR